MNERLVLTGFQIFGLSIKGQPTLLYVELSAHLTDKVKDAFQKLDTNSYCTDNPRWLYINLIQHKQGHLMCSSTLVSL